MELNFWLENWKQNKIGFHQPEFNNYLVSFWQHLNLEANGQVFVPLSGKSLDLLWLSQQGHRVLGVEISERAVSDFFTENHLFPSKLKCDHFQQWQAQQVTILQGDFFNLNSNQVKDIVGVFDRAALIALPLALRKQYVYHLKTILPGPAKILLITLEYDSSEMDGPPFSVNESEVQSLYSDNYGIELLFHQDALYQYPKFQDLGLSGLVEKIYLLKPKTNPEN